MFFAENLGRKFAYFLNKIFVFKKTKNSFIYYQIKPFKADENIIPYWEWFLESLAGTKSQISFMIKWNNKNIKIITKVPRWQKDFFENNFYSSFKNSELIKIDYKEPDPNFFLNFKNPEFYTKQDFIKDWIYVDPVNNVYSLYYDISKDFHLVTYFHYDFNTATSFGWKIWSYWIGLFKKLFLGQVEEDQSWHEWEEPKQKIKMSVWFVLTWDWKNKNTIISETKKNFKSIFGKLIKTWQIQIQKNQQFCFVDLNSALNFYHIPNSNFFVKNLDYLEYKKLSYPGNIPTLENSDKNDITLLGYTDYKNDNVKFGVRNEDKFRHMYIIGKTGMWKSTLMSNMARSDMVSNKWVGLIDPHGDLVETLLEHIPSWRSNDVVLFDVADYKYPIGFNILEYNTEEEKNLVVSGIVWTFKKLYWDSRWPRLEYILRNVMLSLIEYPEATLLHLIRILKDKNFKEEVLQHVQDPIVIKFRREEFDKWNDKFKDEAIAPIINKVWQFLSSPLIRNIFGQPKTKLNIRKLMDEGKILLINLSKWKIWEDNAAMIWSFIVTKFQIDAMARADTPFEQRNSFYLYIDEFQNFATESFENILSEARKYKLSLILANQYISQISENIKNAIFGNVGSVITFSLGHDDSKLISDQFQNIVDPNDVVSLPRFKAYAKIMVDWYSTDPFSMSTFPLPSPQMWEATREKIRKQSRQRYAIQKDRLENYIKNWSEKKFSKTEQAVQKAKEVVHDNKKVDTEKSTWWIELGKWYDGIVKLKYNYWLFVMVGNDEWLLHKKKIEIPEGVKWKDMYDISDPIKVKSEDFKEVNWEKKVVWTQIEK